ncbi:Ku protein [Streptomyces sp. NPDC097619]|uniref:non-homologous end joining protein Ku n=1 Tax=Streptomyces sp. NPDC097619 TaxID=3157228 RepID=UPI003326505A
MRPLWGGAISFGLVSIPIQLVAATEDRSVAFRQIHTTDGGRVRNRKVCDLDGEVLDEPQIGRAYETATGTLVPVTDTDLDDLPLPTAKTIELLGFVPVASIDPMALAASYYVTAHGPAAAKPYTLLRMALDRAGQVAVAKVAFRGRERLGLLRTLGDVMVFHAMRWPDELRPASGVPVPAVVVEESEVQAAVDLAAAMSGRPMDEFRDTYREAVEAMLAAKETGERAPAAEEPAPGQVVDLMAALEASVRDAQAARGESTDGGRKKKARRRTA